MQNRQEGAFFDEIEGVSFCTFRSGCCATRKSFRKYPQRNANISQLGRDKK